MKPLLTVDVRIKNQGSREGDYGRDASPRTSADFYIAKWQALAIFRRYCSASVGCRAKSDLVVCCCSARHYAGRNTGRLTSSVRSSHASSTGIPILKRLARVRGVGIHAHDVRGHAAALLQVHHRHHERHILRPAAMRRPHDDPERVQRPLA